MDGEHLHPRLFCGQGQRQGIFVLSVPTGAHLQGDRHAQGRTGLDHRFHNGQRQRWVLHQRRSRPHIADFFGRAAHVDVDDLRAVVDVVARGIGHHLRVGTGNLHRDRPALATVVGTAHGFGGVPQIAL